MNDKLFEILKLRGSRAGAAKPTDETVTYGGVIIAVAVNRRSGGIIIRFGDREFAMSKKKALALAEKIQKKVSELT